MPDHLHCLWTLPEGGADFSGRWSRIKCRVSIDCGEEYKKEAWLSASKLKHRESTLWQRRYWEHRIRDQNDFDRHINYIHYNPVKHGLCERPDLWPYSILHRYIKEGLYPLNGTVGDSYSCGEGYGE
jgi:putative transposase